MPTVVQTADALTVKHFSAALFAASTRTPNEMNSLTGDAPQQKDAEAKIRGQTSPGMPFVRVTDLSKSAGDKISVDLFNIIGGKPIMGDRNASGKGTPLTFSSMDVSIDQYTKVIDIGGKMTNQRTKHSLRGIGLAQLGGYMPRLESQLCHVHIAGARGSQVGNDWVVPLQSDSDFAEIAVNSVRAPTYNRHYVVDGANLVQGGAQLASIDSADVLTYGHLDQLRTLLDELEFTLQHVQVKGDPAANDSPMWILMASPRVYAQLLSQTSGIRAFQAEAMERKSNSAAHPLFRGEFGMWNGIMVKKMRRSIRFAASETVKHITAANRLTATETDVTVAAGLSTTHAVDRCVLLGAQALANVYGRNQGSDFHYEYLEDTYNFKRNTEVAAACMGGKAKTRFNLPNSNGQNEPTDHGAIVIDVAVKL